MTRFFLPGQSTDDLYNQNGVSHMPAAGPASVAVNGVPWFPNFNNVGGLTWQSCEVDVCNAHAGAHPHYRMAFNHNDISTNFLHSGRGFDYD